MTETLIDKMLPQSAEGEMAVLGAMLIEKEAIPRVLEIVNEKHFYRETNRRIFQVVKNLYLENIPIDTVSVTEKLKSENILMEVGGAAYITSLINTVSTAANVEYYAKLIRDKSILRQLIQCGTRIAEEGYKGNEESDKLLDKSEQMIFSIAQLSTFQGFVPAKDLIQPTLEQIEQLITNKRSIPGVATGFRDIDTMTGGLAPSNLIIVAGRPSMGKTSFCMNIASHVAIKNKLPVCIFSIETSKEDLVFRLICSEARLNSHKIRCGFDVKRNWPKITNVAEHIYEAPIFIDDSSSLSTLEIRTRARRLATELATQNKKIGLIIVDYLQMMRGDSRVENRQQEMAEISRSLKGLAKELAVPVIGISQLSRRPEEKGREGRPQLSDLRESGALEQDADLVIFIFREAMYKPDDKELENKAKAIIAKQRNGPTGEVELTFLRECTRFEDYTNKE